MTDDRDTLLSVAEAAERLHVSSKTVRRYIAAGRLKAYRLGPTLIRLDPAELDALLRPLPTASPALPPAAWVRGAGRAYGAACRTRGPVWRLAGGHLQRLA